MRSRPALNSLAMYTLVLLFMAVPTVSHAANYFVRDLIAEEGVAPDLAQTTTNLVKNSVAARSSDTLINDEFRADYVLQPRLMRLGASWILTVEKTRGQETLFAAQSKVNQVDQLDAAARSATVAAIEEPSIPRRERGLAGPEVVPAAPYQVAPAAPVAPIVVQPAPAAPPVVAVAPAPMGASSTGRTIDVLPANRKVGYWTVGAGPAIGRRLESDNVMYNFALGHIWDINPRASVKVLGEANFSSGDEGARFFNLGFGTNVYFLAPSPDTAPYATADIGYGFAEDATNDTAEGFSFGTGVGFRFFKTSETTMDLMLRYAVIFDAIDGDGNPSVMGARLAVNF